MFRFNRTGNTALALTLSYYVQAVGPCLATPGDDDERLPGTVTFPAGVDAVDVNVVAFQDNTTEPMEWVNLSITADPDYAIFVGSAQVAILPDTWHVNAFVSVSGITDAVEGGAPG